MMDKHAKVVFLNEIETQTNWALNAMGALGNAIKRMRSNEVSDNDRSIIRAEYFRTTHSFLTHLSNVSRLIWPPAFFQTDCGCKKLRSKGLKCKKCLSRERALVLQELLGLVGEDHPIKNRTLRDHLEHFDERIDEWLQTSTRRNFVQDHIGPRGGIYGIDESDMMRQFDPGNGDFVFRGEVFNLGYLKEGAQDILQRIPIANERAHK